MSTTVVLTRAIGAFVATNLDGLVLLAVLFSVRRGARAGPRHAVVAGTFLGFAALVALSAAIATALSGVSTHWFALFGVVPLAVGMWGLVRLAIRASTETQPMLAGAGVMTVATLTVASGGDNVSVYVPLFRQLDLAGALLTVAVFLVLLPLWCALGATIAGRTRVVDLVERAGQIAVPVVFVAVGVLVLTSLLH